MAAHQRFFFCGGVRVTIDGYDRERFFNIGASRELHICEIRQDHETGTTTFWTTPNDFKRMKPVAKKAQAKLRITGKYGFPFFLSRGRKRKLLLAGILFFFLFLYTMSFFVWDISFEGNRRFTDEMLLHYMETLPVTCGMRKSEISCEDLEGELRNQFTEITWVSAEITGTRLIVRVKENEALLAPQVQDDTPCDLAASRDGVIERVVMRSGVLQVKTGDQVVKGQPLVSGVIPIYDDSETLVNSHLIHSDADIYARTVYDYEKRLPSTYIERAPTGRVRKGIFLRVFDYSFYFLMPAFGENSWEFLMEERQLKIFEDFYLPAYGAVITAKEYVPYEKVYTKEEIETEAEKYAVEFMENLSEKGIQIIENDDKIEMSESGCRIFGTMTVVEDIAEEVPIEEEQKEQEENQTIDEHH